MQLSSNNLICPTSIFPIYVALSIDTCQAQLKQFKLVANGAEQTPELIQLAMAGDNCAIQAKVREGASPNVMNSSGMTPLHAAPCSVNFKASYVTTQTLIELGADVNARLFHMTYNGLSETDGILSIETPLSYAIEGSWNRSCAVIQLLILNGGVIYSPPSPQAQKRVNFAMLQLFNQHKFMYLSLIDPGCFFNEVPPELVRLIIKTAVFSCHNFTEAPPNDVS